MSNNQTKKDIIVDDTCRVKKRGGDYIMLMLHERNYECVCGDSIDSACKRVACETSDRVDRKFGILYRSRHAQELDMEAVPVTFAGQGTSEIDDKDSHGVVVEALGAFSRNAMDRFGWPAVLVDCDELGSIVSLLAFSVHSEAGSVYATKIMSARRNIHVSAGMPMQNAGEGDSSSTGTSAISQIVSSESGAIEQFQLMGHLGSSVSGVFLGVVKQTGELVAVRLFDANNSASRTRVLRGLSAMQVDSESIIQLKSSGFTTTGLHFAVISEYMNRGSLADMLAGDDPTAKCPPRTVAAIAFMMMNGLRALQSAGLVHANLTPSSIMFDSMGGVKLGNFPLICRDTSFTVSRAYAGAARYMSPEQILNLPYSSKTDIWR